MAVVYAQVLVMKEPYTIWAGIDKLNIGFEEEVSNYDQGSIFRHKRV